MPRQLNLSSVSRRFWAVVNKNGPIHPIQGQCWIWAKSVVRSGYGNFVALGEKFAHRVAYKLLVGEIPTGLWVLHKCDNPSCIRPEHLFLGTQFDNMRDCVSKGRQGSITHPELLARGDNHGASRHPEKFQGEGNGRVKLTEDRVRLIRVRYKKGDRVDGQNAMALEFGVSAMTIADIVNYKTWRHVK